jgi:hypothetical protein
MTRRTPLYIVCSPQPRVGRTLLARLLVDFFVMEDRAVAAFDFAMEPPSLVNYLPGYTIHADVADIGGQMALFDRLIVPDRVAKVVDLTAESFRPFFSVMGRIDFVQAAHQHGVEPIALFLASTETVPQRAYADLQARLPEMLLVPVYNEAFVNPQRLRQNYPLSNAVSLQIPALAPLFHRYLQNAPFSFADFRGTPPEAIPLENYLELLRWMRRAFVEFRELELRLLLGDVRLSLHQDTG